MIVQFIVLILEIIFLFFMLHGAIEDWNTRIISNFTWISVDIIAFIIAVLRGDSVKQILIYSLWLFLLFIIVEGISIAITKKEGIGGGDIKIAPAVTLFAGSLGAYVVLISLILSLLGHPISKKINKDNPLITYFFIGCILSFIISLK